MLSMNTLRAKEPETAPDQWPVEIGEQMAAAHRIHPVDAAADPRLIEPLKRGAARCTLTLGRARPYALGRRGCRTGSPGAWQVLSGAQAVATG
jgi:hypothetical protein